MERTVAIKKLTKLLGKSLGYRVNPKAPTPEEREAAQAAIKPACAVRDELKKQRDERYKAILAGDAEYQRLFTEARAASERVDRLSSVTRCFKITAGTLQHGFFFVKAEGDSWEEVIAKVESAK